MKGRFCAAASDLNGQPRLRYGLRWAFRFGCGAKLFTAWASDDAVTDELGNPPLSQAGQSFEFHAGGDLLLQWTFGELYLATMVGATAGICVGCMEGVPNALYGPDLWAQGARGRDQFVGTLNLNLVRAGYSW